MKYYTCFLYKDKSPSELHCTHKYFGGMDEKAVAKVVGLIDEWFTGAWPGVPIVDFCVKDKFGAKYDTEVLKPQKPYPLLLPVLRGALDTIAKDQYKDYRPHVTCALERINEPFDRYALVGSGGVIIKEWKL